jgi:hypothetical protein
MPPIVGCRTSVQSFIALGCSSRRGSFSDGTIPAPSARSPTTSSGPEPDGHPLDRPPTSVRKECSKACSWRLGEIGNDFAVVPEQLVADGDTVVALGKTTWNRKSSGEPATVKMAHVWTFNGGKAVTFQQHIDTGRVRELS